MMMDVPEKIRQKKNQRHAATGEEPRREQQFDRVLVFEPQPRDRAKS